MLGQLRVGAAGEPDVVGLVGAGGEDLAAVDDPLVAVEHRRRAQRGEVGARARLGVSDREVELAGEHPGQVLRLLLRRAEPHERRAHGGHRDERERRTAALDLVEHDVLLDRRPALAAVLLRPAEPEPAVLADLRTRVRQMSVPSPAAPSFSLTAGVSMSAK